MTTHIEATPENMRKHAGYGVRALDPATGDTFSATPGDYFWMADNEPLTNSAGEPLVLSITYGERHEPLREE